jgi:hypothetical protein
MTSTDQKLICQVKAEAVSTAALCLLLNAAVLNINKLHTGTARTQVLQVQLGKETC